MTDLRYWRLASKRMMCHFRARRSFGFGTSENTAEPALLSVSPRSWEQFTFSNSFGREDDVEAGTRPGRSAKITTVGCGSSRRLLFKVLDE